MTDALAFVLHGHIPYARASGRWPHGEEWLHEAILGTYLPLVARLFDLREAGVPYQLTLGLTPVLLEQLVDADIIRRFDEYATDQQRRAEDDVRRFADLGDYALESLAARYLDHYTALMRDYRRRFARDLVGAFADLAKSGHVEVLTSAATHAYLPLLRHASSIRAQLHIGAASTRRHIGVDTAGVWLPECAYAPGLERYLEEEGLTHFVIDAALLERRPAAPATQEQRARRPWASNGDGVAEKALVEAQTLSPYLVGTSPVVAIARHPRISGQVWSATHGYPGDPLYREFHRKDDVSGLRYWRVTDSEGDLGRKAFYDWDRAHDRTRPHAQHFTSLVRSELAEHRRTSGDGGLVVAAFDLELFGHWWFEGVDWLTETLRRCAAEDVSTTSLASYLASEPPLRSVQLREGSWGKRNDHSTWLHDGTRAMWDDLDRAATRMEEAASRPPSSPEASRALAQAARELLIAQASDWEFLVTTGQADAYARERFRTHLLRFERALEIARAGDAARELAALEEVDNPFPDLDPSVFRASVPVTA